MTDQSPVLAFPAELAPVYRFLGRLWLREADEEAMKTWRIVSDTIAADNGIEDESLNDLSIEYCRLFVGPRDHFPPFQSVWQQGQLNGTACISMERFLSHTGYTSQHDLGDIPPDHFGLQLDVFGWMLEQQMSSSDPCIFEVVDEFRRAHVLWSGVLLKRVEQAAETDLYQQLARTTQALLQLNETQHSSTERVGWASPTLLK